MEFRSERNESTCRLMPNQRGPLQGPLFSGLTCRGEGEHGLQTASPSMLSVLSLPHKLWVRQAFECQVKTQRKRGREQVDPPLTSRSDRSTRCIQSKLALQRMTLVPATPTAVLGPVTSRCKRAAPHLEWLAEVPVAVHDGVQRLTVHYAFCKAFSSHRASVDPAEAPKLVGVELFPHPL